MLYTASTHSAYARPSGVFRAGLASVVATALLALTPAGTASAATPAEMFSKHTAGATTTVDHSAWTSLLEAYVAEGKDGVNRVDYARFKAEGHSKLKAYVARLQQTDVASLDRPEQFAFWANLYNAKTIDIVLDKYPVKSIKGISLGGGLFALVTGGPWKAKTVQLAGQDLSLDDIEHGILRPVFKDPRVHYAVNCASVGCPNLGRAAFTGATLDAQLNAAAKAYINHPRGINADGGRVKASSIYSWFQADFGGTEGGVLAHAAQYAEPALKMKLNGITKIADFDYDWSLNDTQR